MTARKRNAWLLTILLAAIFVGAAWPMAQRIGAFNRSKHFRHYRVQPVVTRDITPEGFPRGRLEDSTDPATGQFAIKLSYGGKDTYIPVNKPPATDLPNLGVYEEWLRLLLINEVERAGDDPKAEQRPKPGSEQLFVVVRRTPEGFDPGSWGSVRRTEWLFDVYDLKRDGSIDRRTYRWPMAKDMYEQSFQKRAAAPDADLRLKTLAAVPPLQERSVEYFAALHVIPKLNVPKYKFTDTAFSPHVLGWTLPATMLSGLAFSFAFFFAVAPSRMIKPQA